MAKDIGKPIFDLFLVVASAIGFYMATTLPAVSMAGGLTPATFPKLISGLIFVCAVPCLIRDCLYQPFRAAWVYRKYSDILLFKCRLSGHD